MIQPRRSLLNLREASHYHVTVRCVRRAWLCGIDAHTGKDYSHRKAWWFERMTHLLPVFGLDLCAYAIMPHYYELVCHVDRTRCAQLTPEEVIQRWSSLFRAPVLIDRWGVGALQGTDQVTAAQLIERWRTQLGDLSWFMRCLNLHLARRANLEDDCTGAFWETRFKSRPLADATSVLTAMAQVDLSPMRLPVSSPAMAACATSIQARIEQSVHTAASGGSQPPSSAPLVPCASTCVPFKFRDYLELLDWTGRKLHLTRRVEPRTPRLLEQLTIDTERWLIAMRHANRAPTRGNRVGRLCLRTDTMGSTTSSTPFEHASDPTASGANH